MRLEYGRTGTETGQMNQHHVGIPDGFGRWVLGHRVLVVTLVAVVTGVAGWAICQVPIRTTIP